MKGCRGDPAVLEKTVWSAIHARRAATEVLPEAPTGRPPDAAPAERLLEEAARLRALARELLEKARELEELAEAARGR